MLKNRIKEVLLFLYVTVLSSIYLASLTPIEVVDFVDNSITIKYSFDEEVNEAKFIVFASGQRIPTKYSSEDNKNFYITVNLDGYPKDVFLSLLVEYTKFKFERLINYRKFYLDFAKIKDFYPEFELVVRTYNSFKDWKVYASLNIPPTWEIVQVTVDSSELNFSKDKNYFELPKNIANGYHTLTVKVKNQFGISLEKSIKFLKLNWFYVDENGISPNYYYDWLKVYYVKKGDTLYKIARKYGINPGEIVILNKIKDPHKLYRGELLKIGKLKFGPSPLKIEIDLDLSKLRIYYMNRLVKEVMVALGRSDATPPGFYRIMYKEKDPALYWYGEYIRPGSIINGMGTRYLQLSNPKYGIHGTTKPWEIGKRISHGCIRLFNFDVEMLDFIAGVGTEVIAHNGFFLKTELKR